MYTKQEYQILIDRIIELHLRRFSQMQISKDLKVSIRDVNKIINDYKEKMYGCGEKSPTAKSFEMYSEDKSPVHVVIALDILPSEAENLYSDYLRLEGRETVNIFFNESKNKISDFENICIIIKKYFNDDEMKIRFIEINDLERIKTKLIRENRELELGKQKKSEYMKWIQQEIESMEKLLEESRKRITNQW